MSVLSFDPQTTHIQQFHQLLIAAVSPRPIAFVSTVDTEGVANLAPYSFFNVFSSNPPILVFSASRRVRDNTTKDTLANIQETGECVVNIVSHDIVRRMSLTSVNFPKGVSEFVKGGLTPLAADLVRPARVAESFVQMECHVDQILPLGTEGGAGNLIICRVLRLHVQESVMDAEQKRIDQRKVDTIGRLSGEFYTRAHGDALFELARAERPVVIGFDALPASIVKSPVLTGEEIAHFAALTALPTAEEVDLWKIENSFDPTQARETWHTLAKAHLQNGDVATAINMLLAADGG
jgi:flavin reductase (DIM6/NTAB) family NADH-FMN oxidoreductase RutF